MRACRQGLYSTVAAALTQMIDLPTWFQAQMKRLKAMGLGPQWEELLETWLKLETAHGFKGAVSAIILLKREGM